MSTRSITVFEDEDGDDIVVMYKHYNGYPSRYGKELAEFLSGFSIV